MHSSIIRFSIYIFTAIVLFSKQSYSQDIGRDVYSSSGRNSISAGIELSYNIGETVVFSGTGSNVILTQGFEQEDLLLITFIDPDYLAMAANAYPNPVRDRLFIDMSCKKVAEDLVLELFDVQGKQIKTGLLQQSTFSEHDLVIDLSSLGNGIYFVKLSSATGSYNAVFKITKI